MAPVGAGPEKGTRTFGGRRLSWEGGLGGAVATEVRLSLPEPGVLECGDSEGSFAPRLCRKSAPLQL